jgi:hypothetical protein
MQPAHRREDRSQSSNRLHYPLELTNQTLVVQLDRRLGIIAESEGEINGRASSRPTINQHR